MNHRWNTVNSTLRNRFQWNLNRNSYISIHENTFEYVVCEMAVILLRFQCQCVIIDGKPDNTFLWYYQDGPTNVFDHSLRGQYGKRCMFRRVQLGKCWKLEIIPSFAQQLMCTTYGLFCQGPLLLMMSRFNPAWISNYIQFKVWDEITSPFPNFSGGNG